MIHWRTSTLWRRRRWGILTPLQELSTCNVKYPLVITAVLGSVTQIIVNCLFLLEKNLHKKNY